MPITTRQRNKLVDDINTRVSAVGAKMIGEASKHHSNHAPLAWEYFVSILVANRAATRRKAAEAAAIKAGIIIDKEKEPEPPGTDRVLYNDGLTVIKLNVSASNDRVLIGPFIIALLEEGVSPTVIEKCKEAASKEAKPAHRISVDLNMSD